MPATVKDSRRRGVTGSHSKKRPGTQVLLLEPEDGAGRVSN